jgi:hypothetical protein
MRKIGWDTCNGLYHVLHEDYVQERKIPEVTLFAKTLAELTNNKSLGEVGNCPGEDSDSDPEEHCLEKEALEGVLSLHAQVKTLPSEHRRRFSSIRECKYDRKKNPNIRLVEMCKVLSYMPENKILGLEPASLRPQDTPKKKDKRHGGSASRRPMSGYKSRGSTQLEFLLESIHGDGAGEYNALHSTKSYSMHSAESIQMREMVVRNGRATPSIMNIKGLTKSHLLQVPQK